MGACGGRGTLRLVAACLHQEKRNYSQFFPVHMPRGGSRSYSIARPIRATTALKSCQPPKPVPPPGRSPGSRGMTIGGQSSPCHPPGFLSVPFSNEKGTPPAGAAPLSLRPLLIPPAGGVVHGLTANPRRPTMPHPNRPEILFPPLDVVQEKVRASLTGLFLFHVYHLCT